MKKIMFVLTALVCSTFAFAQDARFTAAMKKNIDVFSNSNEIADLQNAVNAFDRIAAAEPKRWEPLYYSTYGNIQLAIREKDTAKKDAYLDLAEATVKKAIELKKNDSEITALDGFVTMMLITVDPESRGQSMSGVAMQKLGTAVSLDSNNPRAVLLQAQMQMGIADFFGQTPTEACAEAKKAAEMLEHTAVPNDPLAPTWGKHMAELLLKKCN